MKTIMTIKDYTDLRGKSIHVDSIIGRLYGYVAEIDIPDGTATIVVRAERDTEDRVMNVEIKRLTIY